MRNFNALAFLALFITTSQGWAQTTPSAGAPGSGPGSGTAPQLQGKVQSFTDPVLTIISDAGSTTSFTLPADARVQVSVSRKLADIKPGDFVGSAAILADDGKRYAEEVHYIPEAMRAQVEGHRQMGTDANRSMTNATVSQVVRNSGSQGGEELTLKYSGGEKTIIVKPGIPIVSLEAGDKSMLKPGVVVSVTTTRDEQGKMVIRGVRVLR